MKARPLMADRFTAPDGGWPVIDPTRYDGPMSESSAGRQKIDAFRALHRPGAPFIIPNPWDAGSARILAGLGFTALATTSSGFALTQGRRDYRVTRDDALAHCRAVAAAVSVPITADLENGFGATPQDAAQTIRLAAQTGLCGGSIEDASGDAHDPIYTLSLAVERVAAAAAAARESGFVLTARAEGFLHGQKDLGAIIERLQAFESAGADVLYAPGLPDLAAVKAVCAAVTKPVNVLSYGRLSQHGLDAFADAGAARLSIGGGLAFSAYGSLIETAMQLREGALQATLAHRDGARQVAQYLRDDREANE